MRFMIYRLEQVESTVEGDPHGLRGPADSRLKPLCPVKADDAFLALQIWAEAQRAAHPGRYRISGINRGPTEGPARATFDFGKRGVWRVMAERAANTREANAR